MLKIRNYICMCLFGLCAILGGFENFSVGRIRGVVLVGLLVKKGEKIEGAVEPHVSCLVCFL